jgi:hypothetical protein
MFTLCGLCCIPYDCQHLEVCQHHYSRFQGNGHITFQRSRKETVVSLWCP